MITVSLKIVLPDELLREFLQHVRDFDAKHFDHVVISMWLHPTETTMSAEKVKEIFQSVRPPFDILFNLKVGNPFDKKSTNHPIAGDQN